MCRAVKHRVRISTDFLQFYVESDLILMSRPTDVPLSDAPSLMDFLQRALEQVQPLQPGQEESLKLNSTAPMSHAA